MAKSRKRRKDGWGLFLLFWTLLLLTAGFVICVFFYRYAAAYEDTRPEKVMDELMDTMSPEDWRAAMAPTAGEIGEFEDGKALFESYFDSSVKDRTLSYRRDMGKSGADLAVFSVYAGPSRLGEVRLVPVEGTRIDFLRSEWARSEWKLDSITAADLTSTLEALTVEVDAPDGMEVCINGRPLREELIIDPAVTVPGVGELEARFPVWLDESLKTNPLKGEYFLPSVANACIEENLATVQVLNCHEQWYGMTYKEDMENVKAAIRGMREKGLYPETLLD